LRVPGAWVSGRISARILPSPTRYTIRPGRLRVRVVTKAHLGYVQRPLLRDLAAADDRSMASVMA
jgi:hypothetical protein